MKDLFKVDKEDYSKVHTDKIIYMCLSNTQDMNLVQRRPSNSDKVKFIPPIILLSLLFKKISQEDDFYIKRLY